MKQARYSFIFILSALLLSACHAPSLQKTITGSNRVAAEERAVSAIEQIDMRGFGKLIITQGEKETLTVEADDNLIPYLVTEMRGSTLSIHEKPLFSFKTEHPILFHLTLRSLDHLDLSGFAQVEINNLSAETLNVRMNDFSVLTLNQLDAQNFTARLSGFSRLDAAGIVNKAAVETKESAVYQNSGLNIR